ncbi:hypothetical protein [Photorhabdus bodei]|uniref:Uncharacterized protein n=1 Tax=Photorhabdus bodei TaxID=2029681 RepID=A0AAW6BKS8_9GAMM|nr:hypothetical protein [Photorhabdus bodei]MCC8466725.1 hypothetical protein [Photorhabdus bodei]MDB6372619.1 hypothetical protein [Photorhabdus bodei]
MTLSYANRATNQKSMIDFFAKNIIMPITTEALSPANSQYACFAHGV